jgi:hypothetical protein
MMITSTRTMMIMITIITARKEDFFIPSNFKNDFECSVIYLNASKSVLLCALPFLLMCRDESNSRRFPQFQHHIWSSACYLFHSGVLIGLLFNPENGDDMFLRNLGWRSVVYIALYPRRQKSWNCNNYKQVDANTVLIPWGAVYSMTLLVYEVMASNGRVFDEQ